MLEVCLLGTGGMMPLPKRYLTALAVRHNGDTILIDCGEGTQMALREKGWSPNPIAIMCFTHYHADHISGLPGMLLSMANAERTEPVLMVGPAGLKRVVDSLRVIAPGLPFEIRYHELKENEERIPIEEGYIQAFRVKHNVVCYGYSVVIERKGRFDAAAAKAQEIPLKFWNRLQHGETIEDDGRTYTPDMVMGPARKGLKVTYSTDTRPTESIVANAAGSDLLICEGMYCEADKLDKAKSKKHMMFEEAAQIAAQAGTAELWLTHFSPSMIYRQAEEAMKGVRAIFENAVMGRDGMSRDLLFEEEQEES